MLNVRFTKKFEKDLSLIKKRGFKTEKLKQIISLLREGQIIDKKYKDHALAGNYRGYRECHIEPDWLLIYKIDNNTLTLILLRTGTHSDLF